MKIAFIIDRVYPVYTGGYEYLAYNLSQGLSIYYDVTVFTSMDDDFQKIGNVKYIKISKKYKYLNSKGIHNFRDSIKFVSNILSNINRFDNYDIIILNTIPYFLFGNVLSKIKAKKISIFHEAWYDYLNNKNMFFRYALKHEIKSIVNQSNAIIAVSSQTENSLLKNYNAKNVYRIPIGINTYNKNEKFNVKYDIIYLGRLANIKHIDDLIKSLKYVVNDFPNIRVAIAGDGDERQKLMNLADDLGLNKNISFLGSIREDEKYQLLMSSKIFVLPSEREGFSISTLEAMYCGAVPIIAKPEYDEVFGTSDFVINNVTGLYFELRNIHDLKDKILYLLKNDDVYNKLRVNSINTAMQYDWKNIIKMYNNVLNSI